MSALTLFLGAGGRETFERSLSKFPNLEEVNFGFSVRSTDGGLSWISIALSALKPVTTPRLSAIRLYFTDGPIVRSINRASNDIWRISHEITRIEHEFEGAVKFTIPRNQGFEVVLDTPNVWFRFAGG